MGGRNSSVYLRGYYWSIICLLLWETLWKTHTTSDGIASEPSRSVLFTVSKSIFLGKIRILLSINPRLLVIHKFYEAPKTSSMFKYFRTMNRHGPLCLILKLANGVCVCCIFIGTYSNIYVLLSLIWKGIWPRRIGQAHYMWRIPI